MLRMFRKRFLPLPFQYYLGTVGDRKVPQTLEIEKQFGKKELLVTFDEEGSIWIDDEDFGKIIQLSFTLVTKEFINRVTTRYKETVSTLSEVSEEATLISNEKRPLEWFKGLKKWYNAVIDYTPFLMITKFLPDSVLHVIESKESEFIKNYPEIWNSLVSPPKSKSSEFVKSMLKLYIFCLEHNIDFKMDSLTAPVAKKIETFKKTWAGFGPREWELPGYESTSYLLDRLKRFFLGFSLSEAKIKLREIEDREIQTNAMFSYSLDKLKEISKNYSEIKKLLSFLWFLQGMTEEENQINRGNFYLGALSFLRTIGEFFYKKKRIVCKEDILFLSPPEILNYQNLDFKEIVEKRKEIYWKVVLEENKGVTQQRLEVMINGNYQR